MEKPYLTTADVAAHFGVSTTTVILWIRKNMLEGAIKIGRDWAIPPGALLTFQPPRRGRPMASK